MQQAADVRSEVVDAVLAHTADINPALPRGANRPGWSAAGEKERMPIQTEEPDDATHEAANDRNRRTIALWRGAQVAAGAGRHDRRPCVAGGRFPAAAQGSDRHRPPHPADRNLSCSRRPATAGDHARPAGRHEGAAAFASQAATADRDRSRGHAALRPLLAGHDRSGRLAQAGRSLRPPASHSGSGTDRGADRSARAARLPARLSRYDDPAGHGGQGHGAGQHQRAGARHRHREDQRHRRKLLAGDAAACSAPMALPSRDS